MKNLLYFWEELHPVIKALIWAIILILLYLGMMAWLGYAASTPAKADPRDTCEVQRTLAQKGLYDGEIDCIYGPGTRAAVARFQRLVGLPDDGLVGSDTLEALFGRQEAPVRREREPAADEYQPERPRDRAELDQCGEMITVKGPIKTTQLWATSAARKAWQTQVGDRYGNKYVDWRRARDSSIECDPACATCTIRFECTAKGVPCR
ncbi:MAG TPA: peptidoglycan-binding domain-containing protein [Nitrospira sp.]|nr:peptidoglycan-binding domain-containing protein [Nitrospira sp.]